MNRLLKKICSTGLLMTIPVMMAVAQVNNPVEAPPARATLPDLFFQPGFYIMAILFLIMFFVIVSLTRAIRILANGMLPEETRKAMTAQKEKASVEKSSATFWTEIDRKVFTKAVPVAQEENILLEHNYDGIKELDNALPPWWVWGFYLTIIFSIVYLLHYHVMDTGALSAQEYKNELASAEQALKERQAKMANFVSAETVIALHTPEALGEGKKIFTANCVSCHGTAGEGTVGPNLTDEYWIHGGGIKNIFRTITNGVREKGMISWKSQLTPKQIQSVASYLLTLQGTHPLKGKAPEGDKWAESETSPSGVDSTTTQKDSIHSDPGVASR